MKMPTFFNATINITAGFYKLLAGDIFGGVIYPYEALLSPLFYMMLYSIALILIYIKLEDKGIIAIVLMLTSPVMMALMPANLQIYFWVLLLLGIASILYKVFTSR